MTEFFRFFRQGEGLDPQLEAEFRAAYQQPGLRYLHVAFILAVAGFGGFLLMDVFRGEASAVPAMSAARAAIAMVFVLGVLATRYRQDFIRRHYTLVVNLFIAVGMTGAALLPIAVHGNKSNADVYWSLNSSLSTVAIVTYGFSRLTARNTAFLVLIGCVIGITTSFALPTFDSHQFGRLVFHVLLVNIAAFSLRATVERRERELFFLARENLSRNIYARELEIARARAEEGNEVKLRFLANMSHEFRTPMHGILQTLELASRGASDELSKLLLRARESGNALLATLNGILEYTRWTQPAIAPQPAPASLSATLRELVHLQRGVAADRGLLLALRLDLASSEDMVRIDGLMLKEVVSRVLDNAIRFTEAGKIGIEVLLKRRDLLPYPSAVVEVTISDTGPGIPANRHEAIFTPFYQVDGASNRKVGGSGLGLAIVARLTQVMGGSIDLSSSVGSGTTVRLQFPTEICKPKPSLRAAASFDHGWSGKGPHSIQRLSGTVLLVEDNEFNALLAAELLGLLGLAVHRASNGESAHQRACERLFDLILMDCQMPEVDGYEATRRIRESERASSSIPVPILAVTANALAGDRDRCLAAGMDDYLAKPYSAPQLYEKLAAWLRPARAEESPSGERSASVQTTSSSPRS